MNRFTKIVIGWFIWTLGALLYAHLATDTPEAVTGLGPSATEFIYGAMMAAYFIGVPILIGVWIYEGEET